VQPNPSHPLGLDALLKQRIFTVLEFEAFDCDKQGIAFAPFSRFPFTEALRPQIDTAPASKVSSLCFPSALKMQNATSSSCTILVQYSVFGSIGCFYEAVSCASSVRPFNAALLLRSGVVWFLNGCLISLRRRWAGVQSLQKTTPYWTVRYFRTLVCKDGVHHSIMRGALWQCSGSLATRIRLFLEDLVGLDGWMYVVCMEQSLQYKPLYRREGSLIKDVSSACPACPACRC